MKVTLLAGVLSLLPAFALAADDTWRPLWNGRDLAGWVTYLGRPEPTTELPGAARDTAGRYVEPLGIGRDPFKVFTVANVEGRPAIRISGEVPGTLSTRDVLGNYHLRLQFKWGTKRWPPRVDRLRDSAVFFHAYDLGGVSGQWPFCLEFQVTETTVGNLSTVGTKAAVRARPNGDDPSIYDPAGGEVVLVSPRGRPIPAKAAAGPKRPPVRPPSIHGSPANHAVARVNNERPHGEWNTLELYCFNDEAAYVVNGQLVMRAHAMQRAAGNDTWVPLTQGFICLQSKAAEIFFRDIEIRTIRAMPRDL